MNDDELTQGAIRHLCRRLAETDEPVLVQSIREDLAAIRSGRSRVTLVRQSVADARMREMLHDGMIRAELAADPDLADAIREGADGLAAYMAGGDDPLVFLLEPVDNES